MVVGEMDMRITIKGKRIKLIHLEPCMQNAKLLYDVEIRNKEYLLPWLLWVNDIKSPQDTLNFLVQSDERWESGKGYEYFIVLNDEIIGNCAAHTFDTKHKRAELGYWLANDYRGKGYMMEAVSLLEQELFKAGINKIIIHNDTRNIGSVNVAKNLGYELEGVLKQERWTPYENRFRDINCFAKFKNKK